MWIGRLQGFKTGIFGGAPLGDRPSHISGGSGGWCAGVSAASAGGGSESASRSGTEIASIPMLMAGKHCVPATLVMVGDGE